MIHVEHRPDEKGDFDEMVIRKIGMVHIEMMSSKSVYIGVYCPDGSQCQIWISSDKRLHFHHKVSEKPSRRVSRQLASNEKG